MLYVVGGGGPFCVHLSRLPQQVLRSCDWMFSRCSCCRSCLALAAKRLRLFCFCVVWGEDAFEGLLLSVVDSVARVVSLVSVVIIFGHVYCIAVALGV